MNRLIMIVSVSLTLLAAAGGSPKTADLAAPDQPGPYNVGTRTFHAAVSGGRVTRIQVFYPTLAPPDPTSSYTVNAAAGNYSVGSPLGAVRDAPAAPGQFPLVVHDHGGQVAGPDNQRVGQLPL